MKKKNTDSRFLEHPGMIVLSLLLAILIWILVNSVNDPIRYMTVSNVQVKLLNTSMITDQGNVYTVLDSTDVVPVVTVKARRSVIEDLDKDDIVATADMEDMTSLNTVEIKYYSSKYNEEIEDIDGSIDNVLLSIESKMTKSFVLQISTSGEVAEGYELDSVVAEQNQVRISGPESVVSSISFAGALVDISGTTSSISTYADIKFYDADGNTVDTSSLTMNISSVRISVNVQPLKTVSIEVSAGGSPAEGYVVNGVVTVEPSTVRLAGRTSLLNEIESIVIDGDAVSLDGATSSLQTTVSLLDYLPDGVTLADEDFDGTVYITVGVEAAETQNLTISMSDITLENIPDGYKAKITSVNDGSRTVTAEDEDSSLSITLTGLSSAIDAVLNSELAPSIDVGELTEEDDIAGVYVAIVSVNVPGSLSMDNTLTASVEIAAEGDLYASEIQEETEDADDAEEVEDAEGENTDVSAADTVNTEISAAGAADTEISAGGTPDTDSSQEASA